MSIRRHHVSDFGQLGQGGNSRGRHAGPGDAGSEIRRSIRVCHAIGAERAGRSSGRAGRCRRRARRARQEDKQKLNWRKSIVDLMKLLDPTQPDRAKDSRRGAALHRRRRTSAKMNVWLHKQVMIKLAANGGKVPHLKN